jgi:hypothetical protein
MNSRVKHDTPVCTECGKKIRAFKTRTDWKKRPMHLKCWKDANDRIFWQWQYERLEKRVEVLETAVEPPIAKPRSSFDNYMDEVRIINNL